MAARLRSRFGRAGLALLTFVAFTGAAALIYTATGDNPWSPGITKRLAQGQPMRPKEYGIIGVWWGCVASSAICFTLLLGARGWIPGGKNAPRRAPLTPPAPGLVCVFALVAVMLLAAWLRVPRLGQSLWNDEEYAMRRFSHGAWEQKDGSWRFDPVKWEDTLFENKNGNNHVLSSLVTRWSLEVWRFAAGEPREAFSEKALRMPALIAGMLTLVLLAAIGTEMGYAWIGVGAAAWMALHPWHIRYSVESKGYSLMLFFLCLAVLGLIRALRTNRITAWCCFALGQAGCLLSFAGALYAVLGINLMAFAELIVRKEWRRSGALVGFNFLAAIPVLVWFLPSIPQVTAYLDRPDALRLGMGQAWLQDAFTHLIAGVHHGIAEPELHHGTSWVLQSAEHSYFAPFLGIALPAIIVLGLLAALARGTAARVTVIGITAGGSISFYHNQSQDHPMVVWYLIYLLIPMGFAACLALAQFLPQRTRTLPWCIILLMAGYSLATADVRKRIIRYDRQPMRQAVASIRENRPEAMTAIFGVSDRQTLSYDPRVRVLEKEADLDAALSDAEKEGRPLYVYFCGRTESGNRNPDLMKRVLDPTAFVHVQDFPGLEAMFSYHVYRVLKARTAAETDAAQ